MEWKAFYASKNEETSTENFTVKEICEQVVQVYVHAIHGMIPI